MGSGASSGVVKAKLSQSDKDLTTPELGMVEEGVQWLKATIDKEKAEKEWLAQQYEGQSKEMKLMREEMARMRAELESYRAREGGVGRSASQAAPVMQLKQDVPAPAAPSASASSGVISPKLQERRGLKLNIETPTQRGESSAVVKQPSPIVPVPEHQVVEAPAETLPQALPQVQHHSSPGPGGSGGKPPLSLAQRRWSTGAVEIEPMSALLRRRAEDWSTEALTAEKPALTVQASKVFSLSDEPESPKRAKPNRARTMSKQMVELEKKPSEAQKASQESAAAVGA